MFLHVKRAQFEFSAIVRNLILCLVTLVAFAILSTLVVAQDSADAPGIDVTANAGHSRVIEVGNTVRLDGSGSTSVSGSTLTYAWALVEKPANSQTTLQNPNSPCLLYTSPSPRD